MEYVNPQAPKEKCANCLEALGIIEAQKDLIEQLLVKVNDALELADGAIRTGASFAQIAGKLVDDPELSAELNKLMADLEADIGEPINDAHKTDI